MKYNNNNLQEICSLDMWLSYLRSLHSKPIDMGLNRIKKVAQYLNILQPAPFVFTVAGTNGKGTTCCTLEAILIESGYKVGVYSSPHLISYTERIRIQNSELQESEHIKSFAKIESIRGNISLTYFEYSTLSALWLFKQANLDVVILEVGLGGRLDATNIVDADVAIITNIALDHTNWLGLNRESIGYEKAGIFRTDKPAVIGEFNVPKTVLQVAKEKRTRLMRIGIQWRFIEMKNMFVYSDEQGDLKNLPFSCIPTSNIATALAALRVSTLQISEKAIYQGIRKAFLPGRFQIVSKSPRLIFDVAHNPHAATYLVQWLRSIPKIGRLLVVIGMLRDKDIENTISCMRSLVDIWYLTTVNGLRGAKAEQLMKYVGKSKIYESTAQAWNDAMINAKSEDTVLVCGSFHTVASIMKIMNVKKEVN